MQRMPSQRDLMSPPSLPMARAFTCAPNAEGVASARNDEVTSPVRLPAAAKTSASNALAPIWRFRKVVLAATGVGLLVTVVSSFLSHNVAATLSGIGAAATTLTVQLVLWIRQTVKRIARL